jgi:hypothetical protein
MAYHFKKLTLQGIGVDNALNTDVLWLEFMKFMTLSPANGGPGWIFKAYGHGYTDRANSVLGTFQLNGSFDPNTVWSAGTAIGNANGIGNSGNWWIIKEPGTFAGHQREFLFQNAREYVPTSLLSYANARGRKFIYYSVQGFLTTATGNGQSSTDVTAINPPIAYDQIGVTEYTWRNPTDGNWNYSNPMGNTGNLYNFYITTTTETGAYCPWEITFCAADNSNGEGYGWYILAYSKTTPSYGKAFFCYDPLKSGTYDPSDQDPAVIFQTNCLTEANTLYHGDFMNRLSSVVASNAASSPTNALRCWGKRPSSFTSKSDVTTQINNSQASANFLSIVNKRTDFDGQYDGVSSFTVDGNEIVIPIGYYFHGGNVVGVTTGMWKGLSSMIQMNHCRNLGRFATLSIGGSRNFVHVYNGAVVPWDGSVPAI